MSTVEQICINCQWFCVSPGGFWDKESVAIMGPNGACRIRAPYHNGHPQTWGSYWCGDWEERKRAPVIEPKEMT